MGGKNYFLLCLKTPLQAPINKGKKNFKKAQREKKTGLGGDGPLYLTPKAFL